MRLPGWQKIKRWLRKNAARRKRIIRRAKKVGSKRATNFVDLSNHNPATAAELQAYSKNHDVVVLKASEGKSWSDHTLKHMVHNAKAAGLLVMPYHFARPDNNTPEAEARHFVKVCRAAGLRMGRRRRFWFQRDELPGVLDYEVFDPRGRDAEWIHAFMREYRRLTKHGAGRWRGFKTPVTQGPILYSGHVVREACEGHKIHALYWLAFYGKQNLTENYWPGGLPDHYRFAVQYTEEGHFKALPGRVDRNRFVPGIRLRDLIELAT